MNFNSQLELIVSKQPVRKVVKAILLSQISNNKVESKERFNQVKSRLNKVCFANQSHIDLYKNTRKKVLGLERHEYAPELNTLHFRDKTSVKVSGAKTIHEAVNKFINQ